MLGFISIKRGKNGPPDLIDYAAIGEDNDDGGIDWHTADFTYCEDMANQGVLQRRGYTIVNDIITWMYYLPPPPHTYTTGP